MSMKKKIILKGVTRERSASYNGELILYSEVSDRVHSYRIGSFAPHLLPVYEKAYDIVNIDEYRHLI